MTFETICARAGCSHATVSRVFNNSAYVNPDLRTRVLAIANELGYRKRPRRHTRNAAPVDATGGQVEIVLHRHVPLERAPIEDGHIPVTINPPTDISAKGMLSATQRFADAFYGQIVNGAIDEISRRQGKATVQANHDLLSPAFLDDLNRLDHLGVVLLGVYSPQLADFVARVRRPLVLVDLLHEGWPDVVAIDNASGAQQIVRHLVELGHRRIGYVAGASNPSYAERREMVLWSLHKAGLTPQLDLSFEQTGRIEEIADGIVPLLRRPDRPSALICANDFLALGVMHAAKLAGIDIPGQLSVVGFDDIDAAAIVTPALTTVHVPLAQLGQVAVRLLLSQAAAAWPRPTNGGCKACVLPHLIVRQTTATPADASAGGSRHGLSATTHQRARKGKTK